MNFACRYYEKWLLPHQIGQLAKSNPMLDAKVAAHIASCSDCACEARSLEMLGGRIQNHVAEINSTPSKGRLEDCGLSYSLANRVVASIEPRDIHYSTSSNITPPVAQFVAVAAFAMLTLCIVDPFFGFQKLMPRHAVSTKPFLGANVMRKATETRPLQNSFSSNAATPQFDPFAPAILSGAEKNSSNGSQRLLYPMASHSESLHGSAAYSIAKSTGLAYSTIKPTTRSSTASSLSLNSTSCVDSTTLFENSDNERDTYSSVNDLGLKSDQPETRSTLTLTNGILDLNQQAIISINNSAPASKYSNPATNDSIITPPAPPSASAAIAGSAKKTIDNELEGHARPTTASSSEK